MPDHWPLRATKVDTSILKIQTSTFPPKMMLLESGDHCDLKFKYKTHLSKYKINNQGKPCMSDHWPLRATKVDTSILTIQTSTFLPKMILLESGDHCDLKFKYKPHLSKYKNK